MDYFSYLVTALAVVWIIYRQFVGRFVTPGRSLALPLILLVWGLEQAATADVRWGVVAVLVVAGDLLLTAGLGAVRGAAIRLSLRDGYLYRRGGGLSLALWVVSIGVRVVAAVLAAGTSAGPATAATLTLGFGVSIAAQYAVLAARVRADGRPLRPGRRTAPPPARHTRPVSTEWGPVRVVGNLVWLPIIHVSTFWGEPRVEHLGPAVAAAVVASAGWVVTGLRLERPPWLGPAGIVVTAAGGIAFVAAVGGWSTPVAFCVYAVLTAGVRFPATAAVAVAAASGIGAGLVLRDESAGSLALLGLLLVAVLLFGMGRRESARQTEQRELALVAAARVHEEHARAAALAERARIARDVHDVLAHSLSALAVQLQGARLMLLRDGAPPDTLAQVERAQRLAADGLAEAGRAVTALRSEPVDLAAGLRALVDETPDATLEIDGDAAPLDPGARETVLRTAQEALSNVRKHAAGAPVSVRLTRHDGATELEVRDRAGTPAPRRPGGYGLVGMAERAALAGAELDAGPVEDGWRVRLRFPPP